MKLLASIERYRDLTGERRQGQHVEHGSRVPSDPLPKVILGSSLPTLEAWPGLTNAPHNLETGNLERKLCLISAPLTSVFSCRNALRGILSPQLLVESGVFHLWFCSVHFGGVLPQRSWTANRNLELGIPFIFGKGSNQIKSGNSKSVFPSSQDKC